MCYVLSSTTGATTITINSSAVPNGGWTVEFREYNPTATITFDTAGHVDDSTSCTSCSGVALTLSGTNDLIVQLLNPTGSVTAISSGWGDTDFPGPNWVGIADKIQTSSGAAPTWTTNGGYAGGAALAFQLGTATNGSGYSLAVGPNTGTGLSQAIYYVPNIKGGTNTVTVTFNQPAVSVDIRVMEYSGVSTTSPLDATAVGSGISNGGNVATANATTSSANELIVGAGMTSWAFNAPGPGFTTDIITSPDTDIAEHEAVTTAGSYNASANLTNNNNTKWLMQMATFKAATTPGTSVYADTAYAPYGEAYAQSGASDLSFTGQNQDIASGLNDFLFREYHSQSQGRWISPDPAALAAVNPMNPQTWNRYAYVAAYPLNSIDPSGLFLWVGTYPDNEDNDNTTGGGTGVVTTGDCMGCGTSITTKEDERGTVDAANNVRRALSRLFKSNPNCAALFGGTDSALNVLNKMNMVPVPSPATFPSNNYMTAYNLVRSGAVTAATAWSGSPWNGQVYNTYVGSQFNSLNISQQETLLIHEMGHPFTSIEDDAKMPQFNIHTNIPSACGTAGSR